MICWIKAEKDNGLFLSYERINLSMLNFINLYALAVYWLEVGINGIGFNAATLS